MKTEAILIDEYIAKRGVRRFERGASSGYDSLQRFFLERGYDMRRIQTTYALRKLGQKGPGKRMGWVKLIAIVDEMRLAEGLEPLAASNKLAA
ncbi:hypothetical protein [Brucella pituitosa]|uniref:hypothetical protein n=2 Tax=Brucella/Ochrobactrum group TaxID=2826938 RepID=UPI0009A24E9A|nr:hypothetical protein [Brucella pituitosa]